MKILQLWQQEILCISSVQSNYMYFLLLLLTKYTYSHSIQCDPQYVFWVNLNRSTVFCVQCFWEKVKHDNFHLIVYIVKCHFLFTCLHFKLYQTWRPTEPPFRCWPSAWGDSDRPISSSVTLETERFQNLQQNHNCGWLKQSVIKNALMSEK